MLPSAEDFAKAALQLRENTRGPGGDAVAVFKGFRKVEEHRLKMLHRSGAGGRETARVRSDMADALLCELHAFVVRAIAPQGLGEPMALVACGGYGRRELAPLSDIDIFFLHPRNTTPREMEEVIRAMVAALWDIGFKVGHAARSLQGAVAHANKDLVSKAALLEARFLCGERGVFQEFKERFFDECVRGHEREFIAWRMANQAEVQAKYGGSVFMQEPNVKHGVGGLRDWHHLQWLAAFQDRHFSPARLVEQHILR
ncbi:MAG: DUF294 nucleotidyltransferase-like domain-containing protein, partial [Terrimicrobiaceae bacterium]|nr:DUF294 nucleotidyltransferase-like domain-containing protein [Terrimicrobiaceae bacterium]